MIVPRRVFTNIAANGSPTTKGRQQEGGLLVVEVALAGMAIMFSELPVVGAIPREENHRDLLVPGLILISDISLVCASPISVNMWLAKVQNERSEQPTIPVWTPECLVTCVACIST